jgi:uncharacterized lipoprotein NlpE involved in copper resistance
MENEQQKIIFEPLTSIDRLRPTSKSREHKNNKKIEIEALLNAGLTPREVAMKLKGQGNKPMTTQNIYLYIKEYGLNYKRSKKMPE